MNGASKLVYVALGSNLGDSRSNIREALRRLKKLSSAPVLASSLWRSTPLDCPPGSPEFTNAAALLVPLEDESPESLLRKLQSLEREFGRTPKKVMNEARPLDLDLIAFGNETRNSPELVLPHPRAQLRKFVLAPLAEIAPDFILPGQNKTVRELLANLRTDEMVERI